jgi:hypothetical protein
MKEIIFFAPDYVQWENGSYVIFIPSHIRLNEEQFKEVKNLKAKLKRRAPKLNN